MQVLLRADGSAAAVGSNDDGQCAMPDDDGPKITAAVAGQRCTVRGRLFLAVASRANRTIVFFLLKLRDCAICECTNRQI